MNRLRQPTGKAPWPTILLTGEEGSGKTYAALALSTSEHVGPTYAFDLGEGVLDQYGPLGPFQIVDHDGTYSDFLAALQETLALPVDPAKPTVVVIDGISLLWTALSGEADAKARRREGNRKKLAKDPDAEIVIDMGLWNQATARWYKVVESLRTWPGIAVLTARGGLITEVENGRPVEGSKVWKTQAQKNLEFDVSMVVRTHANPRRAELTKVRSLTVKIPDGESRPIPDFTLDDLLFVKMGLSAETTEARPSPQLSGDAFAVDTEDPADDGGFWVSWQAKVAFAETLDALNDLWAELVEAAKAGLVRVSKDEALEVLRARAREVELPAASGGDGTPAPPSPEPPATEAMSAQETPPAPDPSPPSSEDAAGSQEADSVEVQPVTKARKAYLEQLVQVYGSLDDLDVACVHKHQTTSEFVTTPQLRALLAGATQQAS